ncbi:MAG: Na(+)/H(+) antiporter subunit D [Pseudomonadales bacterium]|nr:Na(+)/H(+) antiporter subunit D [Pseudomonadales bacterium]
MTAEFPTAFILILGAAGVPFFKGHLRSAYLLLLPVLAFVHVLLIPQGDYNHYVLAGQELIAMRVDELSLMFAYVFLLAAFLCAIYALHLKDTVQHIAAVVYAGSALGAIFAGDLITMFVFWEISAVASAMLIWASRTERAFRAGMRYLIVQLTSGMLLLIGALVHAEETGTVIFDYIGLGTLGSFVIFLAIGIKCAFPFLHNWLQDAYPESTPTGTVLLSAFTTKLGIYALARGYPGTEELIWIGVTMAAFPIFYAVIENDLRRVLAYSLNNQLGFMVVGIGLGTELALNGAVAHAFADILFKGLLFMSMGAVLLRIGTINGSELGGLYKSMPWTTGFCIVGAASISAFPLFSGFVTKSMVMTAAATEGYTGVWLVLLFASAGVFHHAGIKIPYFAFFAHDSGKRCDEAPRNMLIAMGLAAALCIGIGSFPGLFYELLPYSNTYEPYTTSHVVDQMQLLVFSALAFAVLMRTGVYPPELRSTNLDFDWVYRRLAPRLVTGVSLTLSLLMAAIGKFSSLTRRHTQLQATRFFGPSSELARPWRVGTTGIWIAVLLSSYVLAYYL